MTYDFYDLLEVSDDASQDEIKDAFRDKVQEVHPDLNDDPRAPAQFTALKKGYDTLKDPVERKAYDRLGHEDYVAKRLEGLPSADQWKPADSGGSAGGGAGTTSSASSGRSSGSASGTSSGASSSTATSGASARTSSGTGTTGASGATGTTGASTGGSGGATGGSTTSTNAATATGTGTTSTASGTATRTGGPSASSTRTGTASASGTGNGAAASGAAGTSAASDTATAPSTADGPGLVERLRSINYGWPLVFLTTLVYAVGVGVYARENLDALQELVAQVRASGTDAAALREALLAADYGLVTVFEFVRTTAVVGSAPGPGVLIAIGAVLMPAIFFVVVRTTRKAFAWQPTYLYVAAVLAPLAGLGANAGGVDRPVLTVAAFGLLPLGAVVALLFNAFVTPRLKRLF